MRWWKLTFWDFTKASEEVFYLGNHGILLGATALKRVDGVIVCKSPPKTDHSKIKITRLNPDWD
jgi:hypothetical protein